MSLHSVSVCPPLDAKGKKDDTTETKRELLKHRDYKVGKKMLHLHVHVHIPDRYSIEKYMYICI